MPTPAVSVLSTRRSFLGLTGAAATMPVFGGTATAAVTRPRRGEEIDFVSVHWTGARAPRIRRSTVREPASGSTSRRPAPAAATAGTFIAAARWSPSQARQSDQWRDQDRPRRLGPSRLARHPVPGQPVRAGARRHPRRGGPATYHDARGRRPPHLKSFAGSACPPSLAFRVREEPADDRAAITTACNTVVVRCRPW